MSLTDHESAIHKLSLLNRHSQRFLPSCEQEATDSTLGAESLPIIDYFKRLAVLTQEREVLCVA